MADFADGSAKSFEEGAKEMCLAMERLVGVSLILLLAGCGIPGTQYPTLFPQPVSLEAQSYSLHDPFPDEGAGPSTGTRPRTFMEPRTQTRKNMDQQFLKAAYGFPAQKYASWGSPTSAGVSQYPFQPLWRTTPSPIASGLTW